MPDTALTSRIGWIHAATSLTFGVVALLLLPVFFLLAIPIGLAGICCSFFGRRRDIANRWIHTAALIMCSFATIVGTFLAIFLVSASNGVTAGEVTTVSVRVS